MTTTTPSSHAGLSNPEFWDRTPAERHAVFTALRRDNPVPFIEEVPPHSMLVPRGPAYGVTRHADIVHVSRKSELFCSGQGATAFSELPEEIHEYFWSMINLDNPRHGRLRRIVSRGFTPRMLAKTHADVRRAATEIVDAIADRGSCDFVSDISARLPLRVISDMMGIPASDYPTILAWTNQIIGVGDPDYVGNVEDPLAGLLDAARGLAAMVKDLGHYRETNPGDDLVSMLVNADVDGERLEEEELVRFFILLVAAGNETTRNALSHGIKLLTDNPSQRALWQGDYDAHSKTAIEEILRMATPVEWFRRTATVDTRIGDQEIQAGERVIMFYASGNRDETVFPNPFEFDIRRLRNEHLSFGGPGAHFCLGGHLARLEMEVMFRELFTRLPDLEVCGEPKRLRSGVLNGIKELPCQFTPSTK